MKQVFKNSSALLLPAEKRRLFFLILIDVLISLLDIVALTLLLLLVNYYTGGKATHLSFLSGMNDTATLLLLSIFLIVFCLKNLCGYLLHNAQYKFVYKVASRLSEKNMLQYFESSFHDHVTIDSAVHIKHVSQQPVEFAHYVLAGLQQIITQALLIIITISAVLLYNATLFLLLPVILLPPVIAVIFIVRRKTTAARRHAKVSGEKALQYLKEGLNGYVESAIYNRKYFFTARYAARQQQLNTYLADLQSVHGLPSRLLEVFAVLGLFILIAVNRFGDNVNATSVLTIGAFMAAAYKIMPGIVKILNSAGQIKAYEFTVTDLLKNHHTPATVIPNKDAGKIISFTLKNISFSYEAKDILQDINFNIIAGEFTGLSGISGSGKTTVINLLCGFIDADKGEILVNDILADKTQLQQLRKKMAYVKQYPFLIHGSIEQNICLQDVCDNKELLSSAITAAGLTELLQSSPEGLQTVITENGKNISGGQRQRIAIARALYKNADFIILDEPFNELDHSSETALLQYFKTLADKGKIVLLITHNKQSLDFCDKIISLHEA